MTTDNARSAHSAHVGAGMGAADSIHWSPSLRVDKYDDEMTSWVSDRLGITKPQGSHFEQLKVTPYDVVEVHGNLLTTAGLTRLTSLLTAGGGQALTATSGRIGVGNSSTAAAVGQTDLQAAAGSANRWFQVLDNSTPTTAAGVITCRATFATGDGNFTWSEVCTDIGTPTVTSGNTVNAVMLNRFVQALGVKASGSWVLTETLSIS